MPYAWYGAYHAANQTGVVRRESTSENKADPASPREGKSILLHVPYVLGTAGGARSACFLTRYLGYVVGGSRKYLSAARNHLIGSEPPVLCLMLLYGAYREANQTLLYDASRRAK